MTRDKCTRGMIGAERVSRAQVRLVRRFAVHTRICLKASRLGSTAGRSCVVAQDASKRPKTCNGLQMLGCTRTLGMFAPR